MNISKFIPRFLKRWWYKLPVYSLRYEDAIHGKFRVIYHDGERSQKMCWHNAKSYAGIFGGKIVEEF